MNRNDEGFFPSFDGLKLFFRSITPASDPSAYVAIVHGYGDHSGRYLKTMEALSHSGFASIAFDYRGHGRAEGRRADCQLWSDYVADLEAFWKFVRDRSQGKPLFVLGHSHGGLICTHWAARNPEGLAGLILSAPFYQLAFEPPKIKVLGAKIARMIVPGFGIPTEITSVQLSRDEAWQKETDADPLYVRVVTPRWFFLCQDAQSHLSGLGAKVTIPTLMLAGTDDAIASMAAARAFFETIGSADKTLCNYEGFRHEVLSEVGKEKVLGDVTKWISSHC